jgi:replicative DNA helicase
MLSTVSAPLPFLIDTAKGEFRKSRLKRSLTRAADLYRNNNLDGIVPYLRKEFFAISHDIDEGTSEATIGDSVDSRQQAYASASRAPGVHSGFPTLDKATNGLYPGQLMIVAAATNEGKSVMLLNMAHYAWKHAGKNVLYITIENYRDDLMRRFDSLDSQVAYSRLKNGTMTDDEKVRLQASLAAQRGRPNVFYVIDKPAKCTPEFIESKLNDLLPVQFDLVVVDYLLIMDLDVHARQERDERYGMMASELRRISRVKKVPVLTAMQINREGIKEKGTSYGVQHLALSQLVANHADIIMSLRAVDQAQAMASGVVDLDASVIKHRDGPKVHFAVKANFERMRLQEYEVKCEDQVTVSGGHPEVVIQPEMIT